MKEIPLTRGKVALVDDEDYDDLSQFSWVCVPSRGGHRDYYAARFWYNEEGKQRSEAMHRRLLGLEAGSNKKSHHLNNDGLDNRKENLSLGVAEPQSLGLLNEHTAPTKSPDMKDICWAAGIFEGEGHARTSHSGGSTYVSVAQKSEWLPRRLAALFGGNYNRYQHNGKTRAKTKYYYTWFLCGPRARGFLMTIYSLLSPGKKKQVRNALGVS